MQMFFLHPVLLSCISHSIDICTVAIENARNMHSFSANQIAEILHFNDNTLTLFPLTFQEFVSK